MTARKAPRRKPCRHKWGPFKQGSFEDGTYQTCEKCKRIRFRGDRNAYNAKKEWGLK